jgi:undecaprenyl-diphosphatase
MRTQTVATILTVLIAIALTTAVALADTPMRGEARIVRDVQSWPFPGDAISDVVRALTTTWLVTLLGCLLAAGLAVKGARREALGLLSMIFVLVWLQPLLKEIVDRPRPSDDMFDIRGSITSESYPAGHVMGPSVLYGYAIYLCITMRWRAVVRIAGIIAAVALLVLTGLVNVWLAVHWPLDVIGGYLWGAAIVLGGMWAARMIEARWHEQRA